MRPAESEDTCAATANRGEHTHTGEHGGTRSDDIVHEEDVLAFPLFGVKNGEDILYVPHAVAELRARLVGVVAQAYEMRGVNGYVRDAVESAADVLGLVESALTQTLGVQWNRD